MVCYIQNYVIILGDIPVDVPPTIILGGCVPGIPGGVDTELTPEATTINCKIIPFIMTYESIFFLHAL